MATSLALRHALAATLLVSAHGLLGCATEGADDELEPACEAKCDDSGGTAGFEVFEGVDGKFYFHLVSANGEIIVQSQAYTSKQSAKNGAESVGANGVNAERYRLREAANGEWYFTIVAGNGQVVASSETYTRKYSAKRAIDGTITQLSELARVRAALEGGARFQALRGADHQYYFHLRAGNGEVVLQSEGYASPGGVESGIAAVRANAKVAANYEVLEAADGQWYFRLKAGNHEIIGRGETYASKANAERAVARLVELAKTEEIAEPAALPPVPTRTIADFPKISAGLAALDKIAAAGTDLEAFMFSEGVDFLPDGVECNAMSAADLAEGLSGTLAQILVEGDPAAADFDEADLIELKAEFTVYLGTDGYDVCQKEVSGNRWRGVQTFVRSDAADGPKVMWELGFSTGE